MAQTNVFELDRVFRADAADILLARQRALMIHHGRNIDAAGDEVESAVRKLISRRLPAGYYVGQGHILDSRWANSGQLDIIIADTFGCPVLFRSENGTEYFPFESVYAVGEIKSSYRKRDDFTNFIAKIEFLKEKLFREKTPTDFISTGRGRGCRLLGQKSLDRRPYKNPLFSFMLFIDSAGLRFEHLSEVISSTPLSLLPNIICFLDRGLIGFGRFNSDGSFAGIHELPEFAELYETNGMFSEWTWLYNKDTTYNATFALSNLYFFILSHLQNCMLIPPDLQAYGQQIRDAGSPYWQPLAANSLPPRCEHL